MSDFSGDEVIYSAFDHIYKSDENGSNSSSTATSLFNLSEEQEALFRFIVQGIGICVIGAIGIIGNIFSILVLSKKKMQSPIGCFLLGLAIADAVFVLIGGTLIGVPSILAYVGGFDDFGIGKPSTSSLILLTPVFFGLAMTSQTATVYYTVAVSTERYIAICYPFKARSKLTLRRAAFISLGILIFSVLYNLPRWFEYDSLRIYDDKTNEFLGYKPVPSLLKRNAIYEVWYVNVAYLVLMEILPCLILCIVNIKIYRRIRLANKSRQEMSSSQRHENSLALMLLVIVSVFLVCNIFPLFERLLKFAMGVGENPIVEVEYVRNFLVVFNSSVNFLIYCFFGEKFRDVFVGIWPTWIRKYCCCCCPVPDQNLKYWNASVSEGSGSEKRTSFFTSSTKTIQEFHLENGFVSHI